MTIFRLADKRNILNSINSKIKDTFILPSTLYKQFFKSHNHSADNNYEGMSLFL